MTERWKSRAQGIPGIALDGKGVWFSPWSVLYTQIVSLLVTRIDDIVSYALQYTTSG